MLATSFTGAQAASIAMAVLILGVAAFQVALALGLPLGGAVFGGKAPTRDGRLTGRFRVAAAAQAMLLLLLAWVFLARTSVVVLPVLGDETLAWLTWGLVVFLLLNSVANFVAPHPVERWVMGPIALMLVVLGSFIALRG